MNQKENVVFIQDLRSHILPLQYCQSVPHGNYCFGVVENVALKNIMKPSTSARMRLIFDNWIPPYKKSLTAKNISRFNEIMCCKKQ